MMCYRYLLLSGLFSLFVAVSTQAGPQENAAPRKRPTVATTIDFLDYVFYDQPGAGDYYPLEIWEQRLKELAERGINKLYLRVNAGGATLYPTRVAAEYGENGCFHWEPQLQQSAQRLIRTLAAYDPLQETIRIGHQYGVEVWAWESLWDDGGPYYSKEDYPELTARYGNYPLMDPYYRDHMQLFSMRDPRLGPPPPEQAEAIRSAARSRDIAAIVIESAKPVAPSSRITPDNLTILVSDDNRTYRPVSEAFQWESRTTPDGRARVTISGLKLRAPYVKLYHTPLPTGPGFGLVISASRDNTCHVYDASGAEIPAVWGQRLDKTPQPAAAPIHFDRFDPFGWDDGNYQLGFAVGEPEQVEDRARYFVGAAEFAVPDAMRHKLDRFQELTEYDFDGFLFNLRSHSSIPEPKHYGFNPEVRDAFKARYGVDIWTEPFDRDALNELRSEAVDEFLARCKAMTKGRPLFFSAIGPEHQPEAHYHLLGWVRDFGIRWHLSKWFADGSVDGIMMIGDYYPEELTGRTSNGKPVTIGVFREMAFPRKGYDLRSDMERLFSDRRIDEIELYESLELTNRPDKLDIIRALKEKQP